MPIETPPAECGPGLATGARRGLVIFDTGDGDGNGNGNSNGNSNGNGAAARRLALHAHSRSKPVKVYQCMKVRSARFGEHRLVERLGIPIKGPGEGFSGKRQDLAHAAQPALDGWTAGRVPRSASAPVLACLRQRPPQRGIED